MLIDSNHRSDDLSALVKARVRRIGSLMAVAALVAAMVVTLYTAFSMIRSTNGAATTADLPGWIWTNGRIPISEPAAEKLMQFLATVMLGLFFATALKERDSRDPEQLARLGVLDHASFAASLIACVSSIVIAIAGPRGVVTIIAAGLAIVSALLAGLRASNPSDRELWLAKSVAWEKSLTKVGAEYYPTYPIGPSEDAGKTIKLWHSLPLVSAVFVTLLVGGSFYFISSFLQVGVSKAILSSIWFAVAMSASFLLFGQMGAQDIVSARARGRRRPWLPPAVAVISLFVLYMVPVTIGLLRAEWVFSLVLLTFVVSILLPLALAIVYGYTNWSIRAQARSLALMRKRAADSTAYLRKIQLLRSDERRRRSSARQYRP